MELNQNINNDDSVTISEALKRLGNQAPSRPSFYSAVNNKKICEVGNKDSNPDGTRLISWASVSEYVAGGGFKSRKKLTPATIQVISANPIDRIAVEGTTTKPPMVESPKDVPRRNGANRLRGQTLAKSRCTQSPNHADTEHKPQPQRKHAMSEGPAKSVASETPRVRNSPPLRVLKNGLRHLDFEQTKAIRDWADNRLLTVLRPASLVTSSNPEVAKICNPSKTNAN